jgi:hypothetical protein
MPNIVTWLVEEIIGQDYKCFSSLFTSFSISFKLSIIYLFISSLSLLLFSFAVSIIVDITPLSYFVIDHLSLLRIGFILLSDSLYHDSNTFFTFEDDF